MSENVLFAHSKVKVHHQQRWHFDSNQMSYESGEDRVGVIGETTSVIHGHVVAEQRNSKPYCDLSHPQRAKSRLAFHSSVHLQALNTLGIGIQGEDPSHSLPCPAIYTFEKKSRFVNKPGCKLCLG